MTKTGTRALLADLRSMARTGRHPFTGRPIGTALASRLPRLIDGVTRLAKGSVSTGAVRT